MIIFGSNSSHLKSEHLTDIACPHCNSTDSVDISVFGKYAHIFWIPTFPMGKTGVSNCQHCKQILKEKEMPDQFKAAFKTFKSPLKAPIWHFSGLLLIVLLVGWGTIVASQNNKDNQAYIQNPLPGDVYEIKTDNGSYTLMKVTEANQDDVYFLANKFEIGKSSKLYTLNKEENFEEEEYMISKQELMELFNSGEIIDVER